MSDATAVELRDMRWAILASQHPSLRQAAERLNVRQSTLSRRLRNLEYEIGATLFKRTNGGTRLTIAGEEFLDAARRIIEETEAITARLKARSRGESGRLIIGVHTSLSAGNLRATLIDYRHRFPNVETHLIDGSSVTLSSGVLSSAIDVAFVAENHSRPNDKSLSVWNERVIVALPADHLLASRDVVHWSDLRNEALLLPQRGPGPEILDLLVSKVGHFDPFRLLRHDVSLDRLLTLVGAREGILLALEGATGAVYPGVTYREVYDGDAPTCVPFHAY